jgi:2-oxoglutarate dehydrogenase E2 component (dihydrolipoamide succinyltransferase)
MFKKSISLLQASLKSSVNPQKFQYLTNNKNLITKPEFNTLSYTLNRYFAKKIVAVPKMGDSISEGTVFQIDKKVGDAVELDEVVAVIETDKVKVDIRSSEAGVITSFFADVGEVVPVEKNFFEVDTDAKPTNAPKAKEAPKEAAKEPAKDAKKEAPKAAAEPAKTDKKPEKKDAPKAAGGIKPVVFTGGRNERKEPMSRMRTRIAQRLKESQNTCAMLTTFQEVDMGTVMDIRNEFKDEFAKKHNVKLGFMSFFIKATVAALREQPIVNAVISEKEIVYRDYVDISVAVATPSGLLVPVLRNCESMSFADIEKALIELSNKGRDGKISPEDMAGGTFTISNGGVFGSLMGTPIINMPQSAILGMHAIINRPVVRGEAIVARPMMYLALTYDHRLLDGKDSATFLKKIQAEIEDPRRLLLEL